MNSDVDNSVGCVDFFYGFLVHKQLVSRSKIRSIPFRFDLDSDHYNTSLLNQTIVILTLLDILSTGNECLKNQDEYGLHYAKLLTRSRMLSLHKLSQKKIEDRLL
jgi:hypothetical protein